MNEKIKMRNEKIEIHHSSWDSNPTLDLRFLIPHSNAQRSLSSLPI